jgi:hypothetical protein
MRDHDWVVIGIAGNKVVVCIGPFDMVTAEHFRSKASNVDPDTTFAKVQLLDELEGAYDLLAIAMKPR